VILFLGVVIGGLVISMYLPIFKLGAVMDGWRATVPTGPCTGRTPAARAPGR